MRESDIRTFNGIADFAAAVGGSLGTSDWLVVDQTMISEFAVLTSDEQWIHVDAERAAATPFGATIAHGFLTLSLIPRFLNEIYAIDGLASGINYGLDRVRFPAPVVSESRVRGRAELVAFEPHGETAGRATIGVTIEREGSDRPACVAQLLVRLDG